MATESRVNWHPAFFVALSRLGSVRDAAKAASVTDSMAYSHRKRNPQFQTAWDTALASWPGPAWRQVFLGVLARTGKVIDATNAADISYPAARSARLHDPAFAAEWEAALTKARETDRANRTETQIDQLAQLLRRQAAIRRAIDQQETEFCAVGAQIDQITASDPARLTAAHELLDGFDRGPSHKSELFALAETWRTSRKNVAVIHAMSQYQSVVKLLATSRMTDRIDLTKEAIQAGLTRLGRRLGGGTRKQHRGAMLTFCKWLTRRGVLTSNPAESVSSPKATPMGRPPISDAAAEKLLAATTASTRRIKGMAGIDRAMVYLAIMALGQRPGRLHGLTVADFELNGEHPFVRLSESHTVPFRPPTASLRFVDYFKDKTGPDPAFSPSFMVTPPRRKRCRIAFMLASDLAEAGMPLWNASREGRVRREQTVVTDSLRYAYVDRGIRDGIPLELMKQWMGHAFVEETKRIYKRLAKPDRVKSLSQLPSSRLVAAAPLLSAKPTPITPCGGRATRAENQPFPRKKPPPETIC